MDSRLPHHPYNQTKSGLGVNWELQKKNLEKMLILAEGMVVGPSKAMKNGRREKVAFQKGIICSINAVFALWEELKEEGFKYLLTSKLNQDCIENFFSGVRALGGADTHPDPVQFCDRLRILKIQRDINTIKMLIKDKNTSVELSTVDDESLDESFVASELGNTFLTSCFSAPCSQT